MALINSTKLIAEDNRIILIFENPSDEDRKAINDAFGTASRIYQLQGINGPDAEVPELPKDELTILKELVHDPERQRSLGKLEVIWKLGSYVHPGSNRTAIENWFNNASSAEHDKMYADLVAEIERR